MWQSNTWTAKNGSSELSSNRAESYFVAKLWRHIIWGIFVESLFVTRTKKRLLIIALNLSIQNSSDVIEQNWGLTLDYFPFSNYFTKDNHYTILINTPPKN